MSEATVWVLCVLAQGRQQACWIITWPPHKVQDKCGRRGRGQAASTDSCSNQLSENIVTTYYNAIFQKSIYLKRMTILATDSSSWWTEEGLVLHHQPVLSANHEKASCWCSLMMSMWLTGSYVSFAPGLQNHPGWHCVDILLAMLHSPLNEWSHLIYNV